MCRFLYDLRVKQVAPNKSTKNQLKLNAEYRMKMNRILYGLKSHCKVEIDATTPYPIRDYGGRRAAD